MWRTAGVLPKRVRWQRYNITNWHSSQFRTLTTPVEHLQACQPEKVEEKDVGILRYLPTYQSPRTTDATLIEKGFSFSVKQTASDFVVDEITPDGNIVELTTPFDIATTLAEVSASSTSSESADTEQRQADAENTRLELAALIPTDMVAKIGTCSHGYRWFARTIVLLRSLPISCGD